MLLDCISSHLLIYILDIYCTGLQMITLLENNRIKVSLMFLSSLLFSFYLWGDNLKAKWGLTDDWEIIRYLGPNGRMKFGDIWRTYLSTEVGEFGVANRYRPSYYFIRVLETFFWGGSPFYWYLFRLLLFAFFVFLCWWIVQKYVGLITGLLFTMLISSFHFWADICPRLGTAEIFAGCGTAIYILGYINILELLNKEDSSVKSASLNWLYLLVGAIVALGAKENFLILLVPSVVLPALLYRKRLLGRFPIAVLTLIVGYGAFISSAIIFALSKIHTDQYGRSVAPSRIANLFYSGFHNVLRNEFFTLDIALFTVALVCVYFYSVWRDQKENLKQLQKLLVKFLFSFIVLALIYISQYVFYSGDWPSIGNARYNFPGILTGPFFMLVIMLLLLDIASKIVNLTVWKKRIVVCFSILLIYLISSNGFEYSRKASRKNAEVTNVVTTLLSNIAMVMKAHSNTDLLFISYNAENDFEYIISIASFLRGFGIDNKFYLVALQNANSVRNANEESLLSDLYDYSKYGNQHWGFSPLGEFDRNKSSYNLSFSGDAPNMPSSINIARISRF
jgi:hypothetical protein